MARIVVLNLVNDEVTNIELTPQQVKLIEDEFEYDLEAFLDEVADQVKINTNMCQCLFSKSDSPIINKAVEIEI